MAIRVVPDDHFKIAELYEPQDVSPGERMYTLAEVRKLLSKDRRSYRRRVAVVV